MVGRAIRLNNRVYTIIGVLPDSFDFSGVFAPGQRMDFFVPIVFDDIRTYGHMLSLIGRLKPAATLGQAAAQLSTWGSRQPKRKARIGLPMCKQP